MKRTCPCSAVLLIALFLSTIGCDDKKEAALFEGEPLQIEIEGLRSLIERVVSASDSRILIAGASGPNLEGRLIWTDRSGTVLGDFNLEHIRQPQQMAACVEETAGHALFVTEQEGIFRLHEVVIAGDHLQPQQQDAEWAGQQGGALQVGAIEGSGHGCGLCVYRLDEGQLRCQIDPPGGVRVWSTGPLAHWSVLWASDRLILADWSINPEGWIAVRLAALDSTTGEDGFQWLHSYRVGGLPPLLRDEGQRELQPRFVPAENRIAVVFIDGTEWFTRIFLQHFPLDSSVVTEPMEIESCRGTCDVTWASFSDGVIWIWYSDRSGSWAERIDMDGGRSRLRFNPPPDVVPVGSGLFKMGLGNTLANWWAVVSNR
ncbi:MAG: hypothetical protein JW797_15560 [Bradymonadales bacterium]|nr:hypothetical protein [Bradymonadales bacterium]